MMPDDNYGFPHWQYCADGFDISSSMYAEEDATEKRLWASPVADGPEEVWTRRSTTHQWKQEL